MPITRKKILEGVKDALEAAMEQPANWSCIVAVNGQGQIVRTEFPCGGSHKYNDKEVGEVSYFTVNGWGDWDPESKDFQYNVALRVESFGDGLDWEELQTDLETIGVELLGARDSKLLEKMEEIKRIGIKNLEKGTPLYRFFKKQQREFRKHRERLDKEMAYIVDVLRNNLDGAILSDNIAIYRHDDGHLSNHLFAGVPPIAADGSDEVVYRWEAGDYDESGDHKAAILSGCCDEYPWLKNDSNSWNDEQQAIYDGLLTDDVIETIANDLEAEYVKAE